MQQQANRVNLTAGRVDAFTCPPDKAQAFLWDTDTPTLALRVTPTGRKTYVFEARLNGSTIRINIGTLADWPIKLARTKARGLKMLVDAGTDPRELKLQQATDKAAAIEAAATEQARQTQQEAARALTVGEAWRVYLADRKPRWGTLHLNDHIRLSAAGGAPRKRGEGLTVPGPLASLMTMRLIDLTAPAVTAWAEREALTRPTPARLSWRLLRAFLTWCTEHAEYAPLVAGVNAAKTRKTREALGKPGAKKDALQREQLPAWFSAVRQIGNPAIAAYLQALLLTGARPGELLALRWEDVNMAWRGLTIHDKVEGERVIPLTSYVHHLIAGLPKRGEWVFAGAGNVTKNTETGEEVTKTQALTRPAKNLSTACKVAGVDHVSLHGMRRSFKSLTEWLEIPAGVVAQLMGHKPSATAEKHYTVRPLDLLRVHHERIEAWILEQAGVTFDAKAEPGKLRVVAA